MKQYDVVIVGAGMVGLTLAALLVKQDFSVAIIDSKKIEVRTQKNVLRVSAIHNTSQKLFQFISIWDALEKNASPLYEIKMWDHTQHAHLHFDSADIDEMQLGWMIENETITNTLYQKLIHDDRVTFFCPATPKKMLLKNNGAQLILDDDAIIQTQLMIGADGHDSWVRKQMPVILHTRSYQQKAIIAVIESEKSHQQIAYQKFLTTGPAALLPLHHLHHTSLVWSADDVISDELMQKSDADFSDSLTHALDFQLGKLKIISERAQFQLIMRHTDDYVSPHCALIGDAAHTIHPLAGLGVNLGLLDAACLAQTLMDARNHKKSLGDLRTLRRYARWRKADNTAVIHMMRFLQETFAIDTNTFNLIRSFSVNAIDQCAIVKNTVMQRAMSQSADLPTFLQT